MKSGYLYIHNSVFPTLFALSDEEQQRGLMHQAWPPPVMAFVYDHPRVNKFWMKNTPSPLDIVFCCNGKISQIHHGVPNTTDMIGENKQSDLIIELPYGTVEMDQIGIGQTVGLVAPASNELIKVIGKKSPYFVKF